jgi:hypothetical protein
LQLRMLDARPAWFNFEPQPRWSRSRAYRGQTWLRTQRWFPESLVRRLDQHATGLNSLGSPLFFAVDAALQLRRAVTRPAQHWKSWRYATIDEAPDLSERQ